MIKSVEAGITPLTNTTSDIYIDFIQLYFSHYNLNTFNTYMNKNYIINLESQIYFFIKYIHVVFVCNNDT